MSDTVSISENHPLYEGYHVRRTYLESLGHGSEHLFLNLHGACTSIALTKIDLPDGWFDLATPVGFQASVGAGVWASHLDGAYEALAATGALTSFIQTKDDLSGLGDGLVVNADRFRTNYCVDLRRELDDLLAAMARDCRSRLKKAARTVNYEFRVGEDVSEFTHRYQRIAEQKGFAKAYRLEEDDFRCLGRVPDMEYLELRCAGTYVAGGFFASCRGEIDYLFGADNGQFDDAIRLLVWEAIKYFKASESRYLFLGGGIREEDSLAHYKLRFGCEAHRCTTLRMVLDRGQAEAYAGQRLAPAWYKGYFPPYRRRVAEAVHEG